MLDSVCSDLDLHAVHVTAVDAANKQRDNIKHYHGVDTVGSVSCRVVTASSIIMALTQ